MESELHPPAVCCLLLGEGRNEGRKGQESCYLGDRKVPPGCGEVCASRADGNEQNSEWAEHSWEGLST